MASPRTHAWALTALSANICIMPRWQALRAALHALANERTTRASSYLALCLALQLIVLRDVAQSSGAPAAASWPDLGASPHVFYRVAFAGLPLPGPAAKKPTELASSSSHAGGPLSNPVRGPLSNLRDPGDPSPTLCRGTRGTPL